MLKRIVNIALLHFINTLPSSRLFRLKAYVLKFIGHNVDATARVNTPIKIYGRGRLVVESGVWISPGCTFYINESFEIVIGKDADIGPFSIFLTGSHHLATFGRRAGAEFSSSVFLGEETWIGACSLVLPGVKVGRGCVVAAGSVVTKDTIPDVLVAGVPAVFKKDLKNLVG